MLHIGRNDQGVIVGVVNAARLLEEIPDKLRDILGIVLVVSLHVEAGKGWPETVVEPIPARSATRAKNLAPIIAFNPKSGVGADEMAQEVGSDGRS